MKHLLIMLASLVLFACGGGDSADDAVDAAADSATNAIDDAADSMHDALDKAENVGVILEDSKVAIDDALEEADSE
jgi:hypothetical protein